MSFSIIIPARLNSTRLARKALHPINGKPMVAHVVERALAVGARRVILATDSEEIRRAISDYQIEIVLTDPALASGTDRIAAACLELALGDDEIVVNVQGDEPLTPARCVLQLAQLLNDSTTAAMATLASPIIDADELFNPNVVKVVRDADGFALYFSRAPIPWARDAFAQSRSALPAAVAFSRHVGMYAYRAGFLRVYSALPASPLEQAESLEQLRALYHGHKIAVQDAVEPIPAGVDTLADVERVAALLKG